MARVIFFDNSFIIFELFKLIPVVPNSPIFQEVFWLILFVCRSFSIIEF